MNLDFYIKLIRVSRLKHALTFDTHMNHYEATFAPFLMAERNLSYYFMTLESKPFLNKYFLLLDLDYLLGRKP